MNRSTWIGLIGVSLTLASEGRPADIGTAFTYQGFLESGAPPAPVDDACDFRFGLWDADAGGNQKGTSPQTVNAVPVTAGVFTATMDFGLGAIDGTARWLEIEVQCPGDADFALLSPRVELKPAPHALALPGLWTQENATSPNLIGGSSGNSVTVGAVGATIGGGGAASGPINRVTDNYGTIGGGGNNLAGDGAGITSDRQFATVGGGVTNTASGTNSTVGGGSVNTASGFSSTVGGGSSNTASGFVATVGGGEVNTASGTASTVGGGVNNTASGFRSTVGGGSGNTASGVVSTVPGGLSNNAAGDFSFAAGRRAKVRDGDSASPYYSGDFDGDEGTFIWADSTDADFVSTGPNQFLISAAGGVGIGKNNPTEQLDVAGNIKASGTIQSGSSITINGAAGSENIASSASLDVQVASGRALRIETNATSPNLIGGFSENTVTSGAVGATIGGGGASANTNRVTDQFGTVGGGRNNRAGDDVGATSDHPYATVGGGVGNTASGSWSTVGGGESNTASGGRSSVPGGRSNVAGGAFSFAAGLQAKANHNGAFVWGDLTFADVTSTADNQFTARTSGGARFYSNSGLTAGVNLAAGGGSWTSISDKNLKENFAEIDKVALLERLSGIPVTSWNYKSQDPSIRHIGPMGQDFAAAFAVGDEPPRINTIDADGVALAAIQGLYEIVQEKDCEIAELRAERDRQVGELQSQISDLRELVNALAARNGGAE